jgi:hypothetical protein
MRRREIFMVFTAAAFATQAMASEPATTAGQNIDLAPLALPIVVDGRVVNYVFLNIRINLTSGSVMERFRTQEPYLRDTLIRAGHRTPFTLASDYSRIDQARVKAVLMQAATAIAGRGAIASIVITSEMPRQRYGLPHPAAAGPAIVP